MRLDIADPKTWPVGLRCAIPFPYYRSASRSIGTLSSIYKDDHDVFQTRHGTCASLYTGVFTVFDSEVGRPIVVRRFVTELITPLPSDVLRLNNDASNIGVRAYDPAIAHDPDIEIREAALDNGISVW